MGTPTITLTKDQEDGVKQFTSFLLDESAFVITVQGNAGTGKTTLVKELIKTVEKIDKTNYLIDENYIPKELHLTATTNKAVQSLSDAINRRCCTIHSALGLRVVYDKNTFSNTLQVSNHAKQFSNSIFFIDEASFLDKQTLYYILSLVPKNSGNKIIFIGDPYQLTPVKSNSTPVFDLKVPKIVLNTIVRQQEGNPIIELSLLFKRALDEKQFFSFVPDNVAIRHVTQEAFMSEIEAEFTSPTWRYHKSKILAWRNNTVIAYNDFITSKLTGTSELKEGDYVINNSFVKSIEVDSTLIIKTDELVKILHIEPYHYILDGYKYTIQTPTGDAKFFGASSQQALKDCIKTLKKDIDNPKAASHIAYLDERCIDLRKAYACTINKSQGSTYDKVYIDLSDIKHCKSGAQIARLLYVAITRARHEVIFVGDFI